MNFLAYFGFCPPIKMSVKEAIFAEFIRRYESVLEPPFLNFIAHYLEWNGDEVYERVKAFDFDPSSSYDVDYICGVISEALIDSVRAAPLDAPVIATHSHDWIERRCDDLYHLLF